MKAKKGEGDDDGRQDQRLRQRIGDRSGEGLGVEGDQGRTSRVGGRR